MKEAPLSILVEVTFKPNGQLVYRLVQSGSESEISSWHELFTTSIHDKTKTRTWLYCDLDWAEAIGFVNREGR